MKATNIDKQNKELHTVHKLRLGYVPNINSNELQTQNTIIDTRKKVAKKQLVDARIDARTLKKTIREEVKQPTKDTIVEEKNGFGKLKSGAGWIMMKYTQKI